MAVALALHSMHGAKHVSERVQGVAENAPKVYAKWKKEKLLSPDDVHRNKILDAIAFAESSGGKNVNHKEIKHGHYAGERAYGTYGLLKPAIQEVARKYPETLPGLKDFSHESVSSYYKKNPHLERETAEKYYDIVRHNIGSTNPEDVGYSWLNGPNAFRRAKSKGINTASHPYSQKVKAHFEGQK